MINKIIHFISYQRKNPCLNLLRGITVPYSFLTDLFNYSVQRFKLLLEENILDRSKPLLTNSAFKESFSVISKMESRINSRSKGSHTIPASPTTSGREALSDVITGIPEAIASKTGIPNPSKRDGNMKMSS